MDIADIISEFGAHYVKGGHNIGNIVRQMAVPSVTETLFQTRVTDETEYRAAEGRIGELLQPFQNGFTPKGALEFIAVRIKAFKSKIDTEESPDDLEASWLGFLTGESIDRSEWPFVRWYVEVYLIPQIKEDLEMQAIFGGVYVPPTVGTPGTAAQSMDGIKKIINDHITDGRITPITTGALSADPETFVDQIEAFCDGIDERYAGKKMTLAMSEANVKKYRRGYKKKFGLMPTYTEDKRTIVDDTLIEIVGLPSMVGSNKIWATPPENAIRLVKKTPNLEQVKIQSDVRLLKFFTDFWTGVGFTIPEIVFTNDQDLV